MFSTKKINSNSNMLDIKVKKLASNANLPHQAHQGDAGFDLTAVSIVHDKANNCTIYNTGIAVEVPKGYALFVFPRSSSYKNNALMANSVGVIDSGYRGPIHVCFRGNSVRYNVGERIAQAVILPVPEVTYTEVDELSNTERGTGGLGSTGK